MFDIFVSAIGVQGPLVVESSVGMFFENCIVITEKHIHNMIEKIKNIECSHVEQTSDRSFMITS
jgi:hypothetical protein